VIGVALLEAAVDVRDLALEVVDQLDRGGDVRAPGLGHREPFQQPSAFGPKEIGDRASAAEVDQRRVDAALERRLVLDEVQPEAPSSQSRHTSSFFRLRSNPACNM
jgi:hypothetical protein